MVGTLKGTCSKGPKKSTKHLVQALSSSRSECAESEAFAAADAFKPDEECCHLMEDMIAELDPFLSFLPNPGNLHRLPSGCLQFPLKSRNQIISVSAILLPG